MERRSTKQNGMVNFPTHLKNTNEGGTFVRLGVREKEETEFNDLWMVCSGGHNPFFMDETYQGNDKSGSFDIGDFEDWNERYIKFEQEIFPYYKNCRIPNPTFYDEYVSPGWLSVTTIGSTGWTGMREDGSDWVCTYDDLTEDGKHFYDILKKTYPNCEILLMTFIET